MNKIKQITRNCTLSILAAVSCFAFTGCIYEVPITSKPTGGMDSRLLGNWVSPDAKFKLKVVKLNDENYIVVNTDGKLYQAWRSDVEGMAFLTVLHLETETPEYSYWNWQLSDDGSLILRLINDKIVPKNTLDSASVRELLSDHLQNSALFGDAILMTKVE
jgi:hypothetical protein